MSNKRKKQNSREGFFRVESEREREREKRGLEREKIISQIYGNWTVGFRRSKRQSRSMHRELRVGTKILEFDEVRNFITCVISSLKVI